MPFEIYKRNSIFSSILINLISKLHTFLRVHLIRLQGLICQNSKKKVRKSKSKLKTCPVSDCYLLLLRQYRLSIVQGSAADCSQAGIIEVINDSKLPLIIDLKPGVKKVEGLSLEVATIGNHTLCYQAVLKDKVGILQTHHCSFFGRYESSSVDYDKKESYDKVEHILTSFFSLFYYISILYVLLNTPAIEGRRLLPSY